MSTTVKFAVSLKEIQLQKSRWYRMFAEGLPRSALFSFIRLLLMSSNLFLTHKQVLTQMMRLHKLAKCFIRERI